MYVAKKSLAHGNLNMFFFLTVVELIEDFTTYYIGHFPTGLLN